MTDLARYQDPLTIQRVLHTAKTIAVVGLSNNELRASNFVGYYLKRHRRPGTQLHSRGRSPAHDAARTQPPGRRARA
jgi:hypothetical protein